MCMNLSTKLILTLTKKGALCASVSFRRVIIKFDDIYELASGLFETGQILTNYTVKVLRCKHCGEYELSWC